MVQFITGGGVSSARLRDGYISLSPLATVVLYARAYWVEIQAMEKNAQLWSAYLED